MVHRRYSESDIGDHRVRSVKKRKNLRRILLTPAVSSVLASVGMLGGMSALFAGMICILLHAILPADNSFNGAGTVLLIAAIPMILAGAVFLDEIDLGK